MMMQRRVHFFIALGLFLLFLISAPVWALLPKWEIIPDQSSIRFTATQNNAPVSGNFNKFTGQINFDPKHVNTSKIHVVVEMNSLVTSYNDLTDTLISADWFDVKNYPNAEFTTKQFNQISNELYDVEGNLTIRGKTAPVKIRFTIKEDNKNNLRAQGMLKIKRSFFSIGQGEWSSTKEIKDEVQIDFIITVKKIVS